jgi:hypothetical protein
VHLVGFIKEVFCGNEEAQDASRVHRRGVILFDRVRKPVTVRSPDEIGESLWILSMFLPGMTQENRETFGVNKTWQRSSGVARGRQAVFTATPCCAVLAYYSRNINYSQTPNSLIQTNCVSSLAQCADYFTTGTLPLYHGICCGADGHSLFAGEIASDCFCW